MVTKDNRLLLHLTNITGIGATKLVNSLLPCIENSQLSNVVGMYLPDKGMLAEYKPIKASTITLHYVRFLPHGISRMLECLFFFRSLPQDIPILILGDIPLRFKGRQAVFIQSSHLLKHSFSGDFFSKIKHLILRKVFEINSKYADLFIVQTSIMREKLVKNYPMINERVIIVSQPPPSWVLNIGKKNIPREILDKTYLKLIYPAANYPHKNHKFLQKISNCDGLHWPIDFFKITIDAKNNPNRSLSWIKCVGELSESEICEVYREVDALVFLSLEESYGLPIVEAMYLGLPIICPSLAYAEVLCGCEAIYFDPKDIKSFNSAIFKLKKRLQLGWQPNWNEALSKIPKSWHEVADNILLEINSKLR